MIKAEGLVGTTLGTCVLQQLIGRGGLGAVYLAEQMRPRRQVAVKIFAPITALKPDQLATFLERFRQETDVAASLAHPNILPVHEYGEQDGLAYLVMPYVSGGTLQDVLQRERMLPFYRIVGYLEQIAAALDYAHDQGVVHRDIKPANMLLTPKGHLLLADFGLVKVMPGEQTIQARLSNADETMGTPYYMAPEQIVGGKIDGRADIYSLGVILYQMVTGELPFQANTPMQVAVMHLRVPPRSLQQPRPNLPPIAEQVILQALAKRPADRYARAQDLAAAFRLALGMSEEQSALTQNTPLTPVPMHQAPRAPVARADAEAPVARAPARGALATGSAGAGAGGTPTTTVRSSRRGIHVKKYAFRREDEWEAARQPSPISDPMLPTSPQNAVAVEPEQSGNARVEDTQREFPETPTSVQRVPSVESIESIEPTPDPAQAPFPEQITASTAPQLDETRAAPEQRSFPETPAFTNAIQAVQSVPVQPVLEVKPQDFADAARQQEQPTAKMPRLTVVLEPPALENSQLSIGPAGSNPFSPLPTASVQEAPSGVFAATAPNTNAVKLSASMRVIQVPVSGQPGQFVTSFLPVFPEVPPAGVKKGFLRQHMRSIVLVVLVLLIVLTSGSFWLINMHLGHPGQTQNKARVGGTPDLRASATARAMATATANIILSDPLSQNIHNWTTANTGPQLYVFKNGAYHITDNDPREGAPALLQGEVLQKPFAYTLTVEEIKGNEASPNNAFGLIIRANSQNKGGRTVTTFYSFEVVDKKGGEYQFWKYDDSQPDTNPWKKLWHAPFGAEFHEGHGPSSINTFKIYANGKTFTLIVNGKQVGVVQDSSFVGGTVGMLVNWQGTEVAFSNLKLTSM